MLKGTFFVHNASPLGFINVKFFSLLTVSKKSLANTVKYGFGFPGTPFSHNLVPLFEQAVIIFPSVNTAKP